LEAKGIAVVRRDFCHFVKDTLNEIFEILMRGTDPTAEKIGLDYYKHYVNDAIKYA
jgi:DNA polymerase elongation subunit (family B)